MKNLSISIIALIAILTITSCADEKTINGVTYRPYGLLNESTCKNDSVMYEPSIWALCSGIIFCELIIPPVYIFGYNFWEPVGLKSNYVDPKTKGVVK